MTTEKIYLTKDFFKSECLRPFDDIRKFSTLFRGPIVWSWGYNSPAIVGKNIFSFKVQGHHHKGFVWIAPNSNDLFNIYYTSGRRAENGCYALIEKVTDIYLEDLIEVLDNRIEKIPSYKW